MHLRPPNTIDQEHKKTASVATEWGGVSCWDESYGLQMNQPFSESKTSALTVVIGK